jgi:hypothetical protein
MKFTKITDLKYGDHFIWADDYTRDFMCADEEIDRLAILRFEEIDQNEDDKLWFLNHQRDTDCLYFDHLCKVIVTGNQDGRIPAVMNHRVRCISCGDKFYEHTGTFVCPHFGGFFAPLEVSLRFYHPEAFDQTMTDDDFFKSIGL